MEWGKENLIVETEEKQSNGWILLKKYLKIQVPIWIDLFEWKILWWWWIWKFMGKRGNEILKFSW